jgi:hypothetical protein
MLHGTTRGMGRLGMLRSVNGVGLGDINPYLQDVTQQASYLTNWYNQTFPSTQTQQYVPIPSGAVAGQSNMTTYLMLGGLGLAAFLLLK